MADVEHEVLADLEALVLQARDEAVLIGLDRIGPRDPGEADSRRTDLTVGRGANDEGLQCQATEQPTPRSQYRSHEPVTALHENQRLGQIRPVGANGIESPAAAAARSRHSSRRRKRGQRADLVESLRIRCGHGCPRAFDRGGLCRALQMKCGSGPRRSPSRPFTAGVTRRRAFDDAVLDLVAQAPAVAAAAAVCLFEPLHRVGSATIADAARHGGPLQPQGLAAMAASSPGSATLSSTREAVSRKRSNVARNATSRSPLPSRAKALPRAMMKSDHGSGSRAQ